MINTWSWLPKIPFVFLLCFNRYSPCVPAYQNSLNIKCRAQFVQHCDTEQFLLNWLERWLQTYSALLLSLNVNILDNGKIESKISCSYAFATAGLVSFMASSCPVAFRVYTFQVLLFSFGLWGFFWWIVQFLCKNWFVDRIWTPSVRVTLSFFCPLK